MLGPTPVYEKTHLVRVEPQVPDAGLGIHGGVCLAFAEVLASCMDILIGLIVVEQQAIRRVATDRTVVLMAPELTLASVSNPGMVESKEVRCLRPKRSRILGERVQEETVCDQGSKIYYSSCKSDEQYMCRVVGRQNRESHG